MKVAPTTVFVARTGPNWIWLARSVVSFCDLGRKTFANPLALPTPHV